MIIEERGRTLPLEELNLIKRAKKGNERAFEAIVRMYEVRVYSYAYHLLGNREDAQEIAQETFIKLWNALPDFREEASLSTYLLRIVKNSCFDFLRKKREEVLPLNERSSEGEEYDRGLTDDDPEHNPAEAFARKEQIETVRRAIAALPEDAREILVLREFQNLTYAEIGEILELEEGTVRSRLNRARIKLKKILEEWNFSL